MKLFYFCLFAFLLAFSAGCNKDAAPTVLSNKPVSVNNIPQGRLPMPPTKPVAEMSWSNFEGSRIERLGDLRGKVVVLDFWATYCPPCIEEIPHLNELQAKYGTENLQILGLHVGGDEDRPKVPAFRDRLKISYPIATPEDQLVSLIFGENTAIPQTAVFDRQGNLVQKFVGYDANIKQEMDKAIEDAVNRK